MVIGVAARTPIGQCWDSLKLDCLPDSLLLLCTGTGERAGIDPEIIEGCYHQGLQLSEEPIKEKQTTTLKR